MKIYIFDAYYKSDTGEEKIRIQIPEYIPDLKGKLTRDFKNYEKYAQEYSNFQLNKLVKVGEK